MYCYWKRLQQLDKRSHHNAGKTAVDTLMESGSPHPTPKEAMIRRRKVGSAGVAIVVLKGKGGPLNEINLVDVKDLAPPPPSPHAV